jgi:hypothetical protein
MLQIHEKRPLFKANAAKDESSEEAKTHLSYALVLSDSKDLPPKLATHNTMNISLQIILLVP